MRFRLRVLFVFAYRCPIISTPFVKKTPSSTELTFLGLVVEDVSSPFQLYVVELIYVDMYFL